MKFDQTKKRGLFPSEILQEKDLKEIQCGVERAGNESGRKSQIFGGKWTASFVLPISNQEWNGLHASRDLV